MANDNPSGSQPKKSAGSTGPKNAAGKNAGSKSTGAKKAGAKKTAATSRFAERQARKEEEARRARQERNKRYAFVTIGLVVVLVAVLVIVKFAGSGGGNSSAGADRPSPPRGTPIAPATLTKLQSVPLATLHSAPTGGLITSPQSVNQKALTANGKPELLYIGAEYCPHCGGERWPMYMALSKFGTFNPEPGKIHSATQDGNIPTMTFYGTNYSSPYLTFTPVEVYKNYLDSSGKNYAVLQTPTQAQLNLWQSDNGGSFPYVNFGGKSILPAAQFDAAPMQNMSFNAVAAQVGDNSSTIGANIDASASVLIKTICSTMTHDQPAAVCSAS